jgi:endo-1,4-beta-xylanase
MSRVLLLLVVLFHACFGMAQTLRQASPWSSGVGLADRISDRPADWPLLTTQFSHVTPENCMKPDALRRTEEAWNFNQADKFVAFANSKDL